VDRALRIAEADVRHVGADLRQRRVSSGLALREVGRRVGMSPSQVSRIERGLAPSVTHRQAALLGAVVGLDVRVRAYPSGDPIRDAAQVDLLDRLRPRLAPRLKLAAETPLPMLGDLRAWDGLISGLSGSCGRTMPVEAETRIADWQAVDRRLALKQRDADEPYLLLVVADTRHNRAAIAAAGVAAVTRFPVTARRALAALASGSHPGGSALVFL